MISDFNFPSSYRSGPFFNGYNVETRQGGLSLCIIEKVDAGAVRGNKRMICGQDQILASIARLNFKGCEWRGAQ
jgi:hypothetical protein